MHVAVLSLLLARSAASGASPFTSLHPEEALPDPTEQVSEDAYTGLIRNVQEKLRALGFDAGPVNGDFGHKTQTALGQFQLSRTLPASGSLDDQTLAELGVRRETAQAEASSGTTQTSDEAPPR